MATINLQTSDNLNNPSEPPVKPKDTWSCSALLSTASKIIFLFEPNQSTITHDCIPKTHQQKDYKQEYNLYHL